MAPLCPGFVYESILFQSFILIENGISKWIKLDFSSFPDSLDIMYLFYLSFLFLASPSSPLPSKNVSSLVVTLEDHSLVLVKTENKTEGMGWVKIFTTDLINSLPQATIW